MSPEWEQSQQLLKQLAVSRQLLLSCNLVLAEPPLNVPLLAELVQVWIFCKESHLNFLSAKKLRQKLCLSLPDFMAQ